MVAAQDVAVSAAMASLRHCVGQCLWDIVGPHAHRYVYIYIYYKMHIYMCVYISILYSKHVCDYICR